MGARIRRGGAVSAAAAVSVSALVLAFVLCLYPVPLSYAAVILVGCLGAATALAIDRNYAR